MSHLVTISTEVRDATAVSAACGRLGLAEPQQGTHNLFSSTVTGLAVQLRDWRYPVVCELPAGRLHFDNFGGRWGEQRELDEFLQRYAIEKASLEARKAGHSVYEEPLADGSVKLTIELGSTS